ncbi:RHS repeat-associated core domain-containing protein [Pseudomonas oryziphila]|uniref:RHS repeat-associated core domain-containing protein n=1 Tax=Pseudomonas oryziphila TaxID=2894079 RepID=A0ABM7CW22_9PSED|nr:RHS repeat-associated core domain-containing protein [Pseudomonas oryziphila]AZL75690.1 RHS repeat-associated core domain-containing protein [Pseudomonas oryziphila]
MAHAIDISPAVSLLASDYQRSVLQRRSENSEHTFTYCAFGYDRLPDGRPPTLGFNAQLREVTGNYLLGNGYRAYNPALMIFISPDIYSPFDKGGLNSYAYCDQDPINLVDPDGEAGTLPFTIRVNALPDLQSRPFGPRQVLPELPRQNQAFAAEPVHVPAQVVQVSPRQHSAATFRREQTPYLPRVPNNLAELVAAPENFASQPRSFSFRSRIDSMLRRTSQFISSVFHRRRLAVTAPVREVTYSTQSMHLLAKLYRQAQARNTNFPVAREAQNLRRES